MQIYNATHVDMTVPRTWAFDCDGLICDESIMAHNCTGEEIQDFLKFHGWHIFLSKGKPPTYLCPQCAKHIKG